MKKNFIAAYLASATMLLGACTENANPPTPNGNEEKANLTLSLNFEGVDAKPGTKAPTAPTGAIPPTDWGNVKNVQFFAYRTEDNKVAFSQVIANAGGPLKDVLLTGIPVGTYTLVALANVNSASDNVTTYLDVDGALTTAEWTPWNVRQQIPEKLVIEHKSNTDPVAAADHGIPSWYPTTFKDGHQGYKEPSEIFRAEALNVQIGSGSNPQQTLLLQRVVSLLRVRLNPKSWESTVDFASKASILVYRLPNNMNVTTYMGDNASTATDVLSISGTETFKAMEPAGYTGGTIINTDFKKWREINVFPNAAGEPSAADVAAAIDRKYFIVISAAAKAGHHLADGTSIGVGEPVYWSGLINEGFLANQIREVNLTLQTGGSKLPPAEVINDGSLIVTMSPPAPWNSNIVVTDIPM